MFPFIGIMADEEPKTAVSVSGLYNSSEYTTSINSLSNPLIDGLAEFTLMMWVYVPTTITYITPYAEKGAYIGNSMPFIIQNGGIGSSVVNSNGGRTVVNYLTTFPKDEFVLCTLTGSVANNRTRMYINGLLGQSAVMNYANDISTSSFLSLNQTGFCISQINAYNRELSEAEVLEHYVYDDDTMTSGVLGFDAMTPAQKSGLIYSSSLTKDISISGNEFSDISGSGISMSPTPSLTGQQIYVYTDANDLPSDTTIYPVNSANLNGTSQYFSGGDVLDLGTNDTFSASLWLKGTSINGEQLISKQGSGAYWYINVASGRIRLAIGADGIGNNRYIVDTVNSYDDGGWHHITCSMTRSTKSVTFKVDGSTVSTTVAYDTGTITGDISNSDDFEIGRRSEGNQYLNASISFVNISIGSDLTSYATELYSEGTPLCYNDYSDGLKNAITEGWSLANWNSNTGNETTGNKGLYDLTAIGSPTYTNQGLAVECTI